MDRFQSIRKRRWLALGAAAVMIVSGGAAFAAFPDTNVDTYTGCLNISGTASGQVGKVKLGLSPLKPCSSNQRLIHLSGGDITNVIAGTGLSGGGSNGAVTLSLDAGHALPQDCESNQVPKSNGSNAWHCADDEDTTYTADGSTLDLSSGNEFSVDPDYRVTNDQSCTSGQFANGINDSGTLTCDSLPSPAPRVFANVQSTGMGIPSDDALVTVVSLTVPAGAYSITAIGNGEQDADRDWLLLCRIYAGSTQIAKTEGFGTKPTFDGESMAMMSLRSFSSSTTLSVRCRTTIDGVAVSGFGIQAASVE